MAKLTPEQIRPGKEGLQRIVRMLMGFIKRNSTREYHKGDAAKLRPALTPALALSSSFADSKAVRERPGG